MEAKGIVFPELSCRTAAELPPPDFSAPGEPRRSCRTAAEASAAAGRLRRRPGGFNGGRSTIPFSSMSRFMDFRESRPKFLSPTMHLYLFWK